MIRYISIVYFSLFFGCAANHLPISGSKFVEFINDGKLGMRLDAEVVKDKRFKLQIPMGLLQSEHTVSYYFGHSLSFARDQKIIIFYFPMKKDIEDYRASDLNYKKFEELCEKENIAEELTGIRLRHASHFGINKINGRVYVIYLNVNDRDMNDFNYSINSFKEW